MPKLLNCLIFLRFAVFWQTCQACNETETPCLVKKKRVKIERIINHQQQNRLERLTSTFSKNGKKTFKIFRRCKVLLANTSEHLFSLKNGLRLCKCCAKTVFKKSSA